MGVDGEIYRLVLFLHIAAVIVGFGGLALNGVYGAHARQRGGSEGAAIGDANRAVTRAASMFVYLVPLFGIALVVLSDGVWAFDQLWISGSFLFYAAAAGVLGAVVVPTQRRLGSASGEAAQLHAKLTTATAAVNLLGVAVLMLMIWKPGA